MTIFKNIRLGLLHVAVAISFVAINGVLNRVMINELGLLATLTAVLVVLPYILSPVQVWIGQYSDTHPIFGYRRSPYILLGMLLCFGGMALTPHAALLLANNFVAGLLLGLAAFGLWGMGFNFAVVSYLSLASDLSEEHQRSRTIAVMWFMMIVSIIVSAILLGNLLEPYSEAQLINVFYLAAAAGIAISALALVGLEPRHVEVTRQSRDSQKAALMAVVGNPQARRFFVYLILMLVAILSQDLLLEPFGAQTFGMSVQETTQLTALWGGLTLVSLLLYGFVLSKRMTKKQGAYLGGWVAMAGLLLIALSGGLQLVPLFLLGIGVLGLGTGVATSTNLGLMLDMTTTDQAGLYIGAWGVADALSRGVGTLLGGTVRDLVTALSNNVTLGYVTVFVILAVFLLLSMLLLGQIDVSRFRSRQPSMVELAALSADV